MESSFKLGVGEAFEGPFAESFEPYNEIWRNYILVQVSQLLEGLEVGVTSCADATVSGTIEDLLLKASQLEHSSEEPAMNPRRSLHNRLLR